MQGGDSFKVALLGLNNVLEKRIVQTALYFLIKYDGKKKKKQTNKRQLHELTNNLSTSITKETNNRLNYEANLTCNSWFSSYNLYLHLHKFEVLQRGIPITARR